MKLTSKGVLLFIAILLPVFIYLFYVSTYSVSVFFADDFHLLKTIVWGQDASSLYEKYMLLIQQHNEHRILLPRLLTWLDYLLEGSINWITLILIGNLLWIATLWFFWKAFQSLQLPVWMFIPLPWILLQPQYYDNVTWTISILQQSVIVFWFGLIAYLCARDKYRWALVVAVLATFTHGNGIFSFVVIGCMIALERRWKELVICFVVLLMVALHYFWDFGKGQSADYTQSLLNPVRLIASFFAFFGTLTKAFFNNPLFAVLLGAAMYLTIVVYGLPALRSKIVRNSPLGFFNKLLLANIIFLSITAALVSVSRSWAGLETIIAPRYQHYSPYLLCWTYLVLLKLLPGKSVKPAAAMFIAGGILFNALCYFIYTQDIVFRRHWLLADDTNWVNQNVFLQYNPSFNSNIRTEYNEAISRGICVAKVHFLPASGYPSRSEPIPLEFSTDTLKSEGPGWKDEQTILRIGNSTLAAEDLFLCLKAGEAEYWVPVQKSRSAIRTLLSTGILHKPGFTTDLLLENIPSGVYQLGILNKESLSWTPYQLRLDEGSVTVIK